MDVRLPDGTIIKDVPEGTTKADLTEKLRRNGYDVSGLESAAPPPAAPAAPEGLSPTAQAYRLGGTSAAPGILEQGLGGAKHAFDRAAYGLEGAARWFGHKVAPALVNKQIDPAHRTDLERGAAFVAETGPASTVGQIAGDVLLSAAPVARGAQVLTGAARALPALRAAAPLAGSVGANAGYSALTAPDDRGEAALYGAGGAALGHGLGNVLSRVAAPIRPGAGAQKLLDAGIKPTVGDALAADGSRAARLVQSIEHGIQATPVVGAPLRGRADRALSAFQKATREAALPPGAPKEVAETVDNMARAFSEAYDGVLKSQPFPTHLVDRWDAQASVLGLARALQLDRKMADDVIRYADEVLDNIDLAGKPTAAAAHHAESVMKKKAFQYKKSLDPDQQGFGALLHEVANDWGRAWRQALPEQARNLVGEIDAQYSKFVPVRRAAGLAANVLDPEAYTPKQFLQSIRAGDKNPLKSNFLAGNLPQQDLARAGANLTVPREPSQLAKMTSGGVATAIASQVIPGQVVGTAVAMAAAGYGTDAIQSYLLSQHVGQKAVSEFMKKLTPAMGQMGRSVSTQQKQLADLLRGEQ